MPLYKFRATSYMRGFLINAFITAIISAILIEVRVSYESKGDFKWLYEKIIPPSPHPDPHKKIIITFFNGFIISMLVYLAFYFIIGFGGGFIIPKDKINFW